MPHIPIRAIDVRWDYLAEWEAWMLNNHYDIQSSLADRSMTRKRYAEVSHWVRSTIWNIRNIGKEKK